jgi:transposase-like protein
MMLGMQPTMPAPIPPMVALSGLLLGCGVREVCGALGIDEATLRRWRYAERWPSPEAARRIWLSWCREDEPDGAEGREAGPSARDIALALLRRGAPPEAVAARLGLGRSTVYTWRAEAGLRPGGRAGAVEARRLLGEGKAPAAVARELGVSLRQVGRWRAAGGARAAR